jgi:hypothetical protein
VPGNIALMFSVYNIQSAQLLINIISYISFKSSQIAIMMIIFLLILATSIHISHKSTDGGEYRDGDEDVASEPATTY